jgi:hypothetical protein
VFIRTMTSKQGSPRRASLQYLMEMELSIATDTELTSQVLLLELNTESRRTQKLFLFEFWDVQVPDLSRK